MLSGTRPALDSGRRVVATARRAAGAPLSGCGRRAGIPESGPHENRVDGNRVDGVRPCGSDPRTEHASCPFQAATLAMPGNEVLSQAVPMASDPEVLTTENHYDINPRMGGEGAQVLHWHLATTSQRSGNSEAEAAVAVGG